MSASFRTVTPPRLIAMLFDTLPPLLPSCSFGVMNQERFGVKSSGHLSPTRYVLPDPTGHPFALAHATPSLCVASYTDDPIERPAFATDSVRDEKKLFTFSTAFFASSMNFVIFPNIASTVDDMNVDIAVTISDTFVFIHSQAPPNVVFSDSSISGIDVPKIAAIVLKM